MLIIEGPDLVGKTTLARELVRKITERGHPHVYHHLSRLPDSFDRYWGYYRLASPFVVQDRFHMSEPLYAWARGDEPGKYGLTPERYRQVDGMLRLVGAFTVVLFAADPVILDQRFDKSREMYGLDLIRQVNFAYRDVYLHRQWRGYYFDFDMLWGATLECPFPTDALKNEIVDRYCERLDSVWKTLSLKDSVRNLCDLRQ